MAGTNTPDVEYLEGLIGIRVIGLSGCGAGSGSGLARLRVQAHQPLPRPDLPSMVIEELDR